MDSPDFLISSLRILTFFEIPIHFLGFYCIIFHTSKKMKSLKYAMLRFCLWSALLDISISWATVPFVFFPILAGIPMGILSRSFEIQPIPQIIIVVYLLVGVCCSLVGILENQYTKIITKSKTHENLQIFIYIINFLIATTVLVILAINVPDQELAKHEIQLIPKIYLDLPNFFILSLNNFFVGIFLSSGGILIIAQCLFFFISTLRELYANKSISVRTRTLQNRFFTLICVQIAIPFTLLALPVAYIVYSCSIGFHSQTLNNLVFIFLSLHGTLSTLSIIFLHSPYRKAVFSIFRFRFIFAKKSRTEIASIY
ncbi:unnamed protein product [Caenorhabditis angaria]|uniref:Serpentine Receptor, class H n=1 Tax=Caenorhabditis angaria TaxID=860376 RepID=A0A9P1IMW5_9PELO|nr:unnamed protein product [Caenorhabditis angaria]